VTATLPPPTPGTEVPRPQRKHRAALVALGVVAVIALVVAVALHQTSPPQPSALYDPPASLATFAPGDVLQAEPFVPAVPGAVAWRVLYRSSDPSGNPIAVSGVVVAPASGTQAGGTTAGGTQAGGRADDDPPADPRPVVAWAHPTTGVARGCAPSLLGDPTSAMYGIDTAIANGWVWAATDYPGLGTPGPHPYLIGVSEARAVLDIVRASASLTTGAGTSFAVWGHSQGGQAALWTGIEAPTYAPELDLIGVAAAAPAIELAELVTADVNTLGGRLLLSMGLVAWSEVFADAPLDVALQPLVRPVARGIAARCIETQAQSLAALPEVATARVLPFLAIDPVTTEPWAGILSRNTPSGPIDAPLFVGQGLTDPIISPASTRRAMQARCDANELVQFTTYPGVGHVAAGKVTAPDAMAWIQKLFDRAEPTSNCDDLPTTANP
jgi:pimeloyl-ACP methyl ester carboxylesterase